MREWRDLPKVPGRARAGNERQTAKLGEWATKKWNRCRHSGAGRHPARRLLTATVSLELASGPINNRPQLAKLPHNGALCLACPYTRLPATLPANRGGVHFYVARQTRWPVDAGNGSLCILSLEIAHERLIPNVRMADILMRSGEATASSSAVPRFRVEFKPAFARPRLTSSERNLKWRYKDCCSTEPLQEYWRSGADCSCQYSPL